MTDAASPSPTPGTGGTLDEAVKDYADILAAEDTQEEGEASPPDDEDDREDAAGEDADDGEDEGDPDGGDEADEDDDEGDDDGEESDEDDSEDSDDEDDDKEKGKGKDEPKFTVKVDGEEVEVTQSELLAGYSRQADYTRKTQALSQERESFKEEQESVRAERKQYATLLEKLEDSVKQAAGPEPDWDELYRKDPNEWVRQRELHRARKERLDAIAAEKERVQQADEKERQEQIRQHVATERGRVLEAIPEWKDEKKAEAEQKEIVAYAMENGYTPEELQRIYDHRAVATLRKAMLYDKAAKAGSKAKAKSKAAGKAAGPKTATPGKSRSGKHGQSKQRAQAEARLAQSGDLDDAAALLTNIL